MGASQLSVRGETNRTDWRKPGCVNLSWGLSSPLISSLYSQPQPACVFLYIKQEWNADRRAEFHAIIQEAALLKRCQISNLIPPAPPFQWQTGVQPASPNTGQGVQNDVQARGAKMQNPCPLHRLALCGKGATVHDRWELQSRAALCWGSGLFQWLGML